MDARQKWLVSIFILACSQYSYAEDVPSTPPLDYGYLYANLSAGTLDENVGVNSNVSAFLVGGHYQLSSDWFATAEYEARFIHPEDTTSEIYTLLPGVFYRYNIFDGLDFLTGLKTGLLSAEQTNNDTDESISKDNHFMWGGHIALRYVLSEKWNAEGTAEIRRSDILDEEVYTLRGDYFLTSRISFGGFYQHRHENDATTNEGGISMRFYY